MLNSKAFGFSTHCKVLEGVIKKVTGALASSQSPSFFIVGSKKKVAVVGMSGDTFASVTIPDTKADAEGAFGFAPDILVGLIKNRNEMDFAFNGNECNYKQVKGQYKGHIVTLPVTGDQQSTCDTFITGGKKADMAIPADAITLLKSGLLSTNVKDVYQGTTLMSFIILDKKGNLSVSSFDPQHFGLFKLDSGVKGLQFRAALPASHFSLIDQIAGGEDIKFAITPSSVRVEGRSFTLVLPATQAEDSHYDMVENFVAGLSKPVFRCTYDPAQLTTLTDNLFTLYNANTTFAISYKEGGSAINVSFTTPSGTASDSMKVKSGKTSKAFKANVDPRLFKDILLLSRAIKEPELAVTDNVVIMQGTTSEEASLFLACARSEG